MKVYELSPLDGVEIIVADGKESRDLLLRRLDGAAWTSDWPTPPVTLVTVDEKGRPLDYTDMPYFGGGSPILRAAGLQAVDGLPGDFETLPLSCADGEFWVLNATRVLHNAINEDQSGIVRIASGKVIAVKHPAFDADVIHDAPLFRIGQLPSSNIYFSEAWKLALSTLRNVEFRVVWDSEEPSAAS